jgi:hypothetical protein
LEKSNIKYKKMKVFDCSDMPPEIRARFFDKAGSPSFGGGNDCLVEWLVHDHWKTVWDKKGYHFKNIHGEQVPCETYNGREILKEKKNKTSHIMIERGDNVVSDWLYDGGANIGETVVVKHWW